MVRKEIKKPQLTSMEANREEASEEEVCDQPVSPTGQYFSSSVLSVSILAVLELEISMDEALAMTLLKNVFLGINSRFSSIMVTNEHGIKQWKMVPVKLEDHLKVPTFPLGMSLEFYDMHFQEYLSKIAMDRLPNDRPLWEVHIIKYPTSNGAGTVVFKLHHSLGDGYSLMGALLSCLKRADDPSLPLTFPPLRSNHKTRKNLLNTLRSNLSLSLNTTMDFISSLMKTSVVIDDQNAIRSGKDGLAFYPVNISTTSFTLERIKQIKAKLGGTVNEIVVGIIFYGIRLYMQTVSKASNNLSATALVLLNTREISGYQTIEDMKKPNAESPWGNQFAFIPIPIPKSNDAEIVDPLKFFCKAKKTIHRKKNSLAVALIGRVLEMIRKLKGPEATSACILRTLINTSSVITSLIGPTEKITVGNNHPCNGMYYMVVNAPQSLTITVMSYMGKLRVAIGAEKDYINHHQLISCFDNAFTEVFHATNALTT